MQKVRKDVLILLKLEKYWKVWKNYKLREKIKVE